MSKLITRPEVFLVGETKLLEDGVFDYLRASGNTDFIATINEARMGGASDAQIMCSMFAKICYASLVMGKNDNLTRIRSIQDNFKSVLQTGHGCYDSETEVLTADGWKFWEEVTESDQFATRSEDGEIEYHRPTALIRKEYRGRMYRVDSQQVDLLVTPNHNMLVCKTTTKEGRKKQHFSAITAEALGHVSHAYVKTGCWSGGNRNPGHNEIMWQLLGFTIGDGHLHSRNRLRFRLRRERKITYLKFLISQLGSFRLVEKPESDVYVVELPENNDDLTMLFNSIYTEDKEKQIPDGLLLGLDSDDLEALFTGLMQADGSEGPTGDVFDTTSRRLADQFQQLCLHIGLASNVSYVYEKEDRPTSFGDKPLIRLSVVRRALKPEVNKWSGCQGRTYWVEDWEGEVFCAEVPNHTLYVRRNGRTVWCGNSILEHIQFNYIVHNCSRVFSHEQVRHRVGTAFSQTSGRYVRSDQVSLVLDPILNPVIDEIQSVLEFIEAKYAQMVDKLAVNQQDMHTKKKMTSALRRIMPNGQANEMAVSLNLRSLRHTIMMRTAAGAEWEIREVYGQIYRIMKGRYPELFQDACEREVDGALEVYGMKMQPYEMALDSYSEAELRSAVALKTIQKVM